MNAIDVRLLRKFLKLAGDDLHGEWILIGGTLLPVLGVDYRVTTDIDLIGLGASEQAQALKLMELSEKLGLPIETINQAGAYFLSKIPDHKDHLVLLHQGKSAVIHRPDAELFLRLKIPRLSESDLTDCLEYLKLSRAQGEILPVQKLQKILKKELAASSSEDRRARLLKLSEAL